MHAPNKRWHARGLMVALVLALTAGAGFVGCEPNNTTDQFQVTITTVVQDYAFNTSTLTKGAAIGNPTTVTNEYGYTQDEWKSPDAWQPAADQNDPQWVNRDESGASTSTDSAVGTREVIKGGGTPSPYGCRGYTQYVSAKDSFNINTLYTYHYSYDWCWYLTQVYNQTYHREITHIDPAWGYDGLVDSYSAFYSYRGFYHAGYEWYRKLQFSCEFFTVSCGHRTPWNKFWAHGDGTFSTSTSQMQ